MFAAAVVATAASIILTILVLFANMMSDAPTDGFQGTDVMAIAWMVSLGIWIVFAVSRIW